MDATPVLMDFGLVWALEEAGGRAVLSIDAARGGTIVYMARPEQERAASGWMPGETSSRSDA